MARRDHSRRWSSPFLPSLLCSSGETFSVLAGNSWFRTSINQTNEQQTASNIWCCVNAKLRWHLCPCCTHIAASIALASSPSSGPGVCQITTLFAVIASIALALLPALRCVVALILLPSLPSLRWRPCPCHPSVTTSITLASLPYSQWCLPNCNVTHDMLLYAMSSSCSLSSCVALSLYPTLS